MAKINVSAQINKALGDFSVEVIRATNNAQDAVAKEGASKLKDSSPRRTGGGKHYAQGWAVKRERGSMGINEVVIYNKNKPQLTHLLEKGHVIRNAKGTYGRTQPIKHIEPVYEWASDALVKKIEEELK